VGSDVAAKVIMRLHRLLYTPTQYPASLSMFFFVFFKIFLLYVIENDGNWVIINTDKQHYLKLFKGGYACEQ
jgi:hypothetical protein